MKAGDKLLSVFRKQKYEFEKELKNLEIILDRDCESDIKLKELITAYYNECKKHPDEFNNGVDVIYHMQNAAMIGKSFDECLEYARMKLNIFD